MKVVFVALVVILAALVSTASAQDPVVDAAATITAATVQANQRREAQAYQATVQAQSAIATTQAQSAIATRSTQYELDRQRGATATADAINSLGAQQALEATATAQTVFVRAVETKQAIEAEATRTAYAALLEESRERARFGTMLLYAAGLIVLMGCAYVVWSWARLVGRRVELPPVVEAVVVDAEFTPTSLPALPGPNRRMSGVRVVDDPAMTARALEIFERYWREQHGDAAD